MLIDVQQNPIYHHCKSSFSAINNGALFKMQMPCFFRYCVEKRRERMVTKPGVCSAIIPSLGLSSSRNEVNNKF